MLLNYYIILDYDSLLSFLPFITIFSLLFSLVLVITIKITDGRLLLGYSYFLPFFLKLQPGHIVIYGRTGSGKSNTAKLMAAKISRRLPVLILDWAGEYDLKSFEKLVPGRNFKLNPLQHIYGDLSEHIDFLVDLFGDIFQLSDPMKFMLRKSLKKAFKNTSSPLLADLLDTIDSVPIKSYYDHETKMAIKRRLTHLVEGYFERAFSGMSHDISYIFSRNIIIDLSVFRSVHVKILFNLILLKMLYDFVVSQKLFSSSVNHVIIIEEAWNIVPYRRLDYAPLLGERLFAELRKYGECIIAVSQSPVETSWSLAKNARIVIIHNILDKDVELIFGLNVNRPTSKLSPGQAYVIQDTNVKLVKFFEYNKTRDFFDKIKNVRFNRIFGKRKTTVDSHDQLPKIEFYY